MPPEAALGGGAWTIWLFLGGRGAGKTRAGAEWVRGIARLLRRSPRRGAIALVGETLADARSVMVEGASGLLARACAGRAAALRAVEAHADWPNGAVAQLFSADEPEVLRGPQFDAAWCDEFGKWRDAEAAWDMLQFGLRLGERPRQVVDHDAAPDRADRSAARRSAGGGDARRDRGERRQSGARLLRRVVGALWRHAARPAGARRRDDRGHRRTRCGTRALIERGARRAPRPRCARIVVAVDPPASAGPHADAAASSWRGSARTDAAMCSPTDGRAARAARLGGARRSAPIGSYEADRIVAEVNQGGDMVEAVIAQAGRACRCARCVRRAAMAARRADRRALRAGPRRIMSARSPRWKTRCATSARRQPAGASPDRVDALVWALTELLLARAARAAGATT